MFKESILLSALLLSTSTLCWAAEAPIDDGSKASSSQTRILPSRSEEKNDEVEAHEASAETSSSDEEISLSETDKSIKDGMATYYATIKELRRGETRDALAKFQALLSLRNTSGEYTLQGNTRSELLLSAGISLTDRGNHERAIQYFKEALKNMDELNEGNQKSHSRIDCCLLLTRSFLHLGKYEEAFTALEQIPKEEPFEEISQLAVYFSLKGISLFRLNTDKSRVEALLALEKAITIMDADGQPCLSFSDFIPTMETMGYALCRDKDYKRTISLLERALDLKDTNGRHLFDQTNTKGLYLTMAEAAEELGNHSKSQFYLRKALQSEMLPCVERQQIEQRLKRVQIKLKRPGGASSSQRTHKDEPSVKTPPKRKTGPQPKLTQDDIERNKHAVDIRDEAQDLMKHKQFGKAKTLLKEFLDENQKRTKTVKYCERLLTEAEASHEEQLKKHAETHARKAEEKRKFQEEKQRQEEKKAKKGKKANKTKKPSSPPTPDFSDDSSDESEPQIRRKKRKNKATSTSPSAPSTDVSTVIVQDAPPSDERNEARTPQRRPRLERTSSTRGVTIPQETRQLIHRNSRLEVRKAMASGILFNSSAFTRKMVAQHGGHVGTTARKAAEKAVTLSLKAEMKLKKTTKSAGTKDAHAYTAQSYRGKAISSVEDISSMAEKGLVISEVTSRLEDIFERLTGAAPHSPTTWKDGDYHFESLRDHKNTYSVRINKEQRVFFRVNEKTHTVTVLQVGKHGLKKGRG